jgi:hypothetical protein
LGLAACIVAFSSSAQDAALPTPDDRLVAELNEYLEYCIGEAERAGATDVERHLHLGPRAIRELPLGGEQVLILDASEMQCEYGGYGYCGSAGCSVWVFTANETHILIGELYLKESIAIPDTLLLCEPGDETLKTCRSVLDLIH